VKSEGANDRILGYWYTPPEFSMNMNDRSETEEIEARDEQGRTPLYYAVRTYKNRHMHWNWDKKKETISAPRE
jgi:hypothetical protein